MSKYQGTIPIIVPITVVIGVVTSFIVWGYPVSFSSDILQEREIPSSNSEESLITQK